MRQQIRSRQTLRDARQTLQMTAPATSRKHPGSLRSLRAAATAPKNAPALVPEAFVIGLMLDAGVPLMSRPVGDAYPALYTECPSPDRRRTIRQTRCRRVHTTPSGTGKSRPGEPRSRLFRLPARRYERRPALCSDHSMPFRKLPCNHRRTGRPGGPNLPANPNR